MSLAGLACDRMGLKGATVTTSAFDEMSGDGSIRSPYAAIADWLASTPADVLALKRDEAELIFRRTGITFAVYTEGGDPERLIPLTSSRGSSMRMNGRCSSAASPSG